MNETGLASCSSLTPDGIGAAVVSVEAHLARGLPTLGVIGLPGASIGEARWRVRSAVANSGLPWPGGRITIALSPAELPKNGTGLDLAIALALLMADGHAVAIAGDLAVIGELGLDGQVRAVRGVLAMTLEAQRVGFRRVMVPVEDAGMANLVPGIGVLGVRSLTHALAVLRGEEAAAEPRAARRSVTSESGSRELDLSEVRGQATARLAIEVMAAGGHHGLLVGEAGAGKTMLAERLPSIIPPLSEQEQLEVTAIHATRPVSSSRDAFIATRPFIAPHHTATVPAMIGSVRQGGVRPGAVTFAHRGVLFMDEAPEFARPVLEALREPMESQSISLARASGTATLPADCQVIMAANPCPCGAVEGVGTTCNCSSVERRRYTRRLSGPLIDRIDIRVPIARPSRADLHADPPEGSASVRERVLAARERMLARNGGIVNARVPMSLLRGMLAPDADGTRILAGLTRTSLRGLDRILRLSWTLADLAGGPRPTGAQVHMAMSLRGGDA